MNKKIIFQKCNFNNIYFLLYLITFILIQILYNLIEPNEFEDENPGKKDCNYFLLSQQLIDTYSSIISNFFAIIPYLISKKLLKKKKC